MTALTSDAARFSDCWCGLRRAQRVSMITLRSLTQLSRRDAWWSKDCQSKSCV